MRRGTISCFERGALNLRGNHRLLWTVLLKSLLSMAVIAATLIPALKLLGLGDLYLDMMSGNSEGLVDALPRWMSLQHLPAELPWAVAVLLLGGLIQVLIQTFLDGGVLGTLAAGDRQAPSQATATQALTADWFETFNWGEFFGWGGQLVWRLLIWRVPVAVTLVLVSMVPFFLMGMLMGGMRGTALVAGCLAVLIVSTLLLLLWLWWWVVEMHLPFLPLGQAIRRGSRSFIRRGGAWLMMIGIAFLVMLAASVPVLLLSWSVQMFAGSNLVAVVVGQIVSGVIQALAMGAVVLLVWGAAIALARDQDPVNQDPVNQDAGNQDTVNRDTVDRDAVNQGTVTVTSNSPAVENKP